MQLERIITGEKLSYLCADQKYFYADSMARIEAAKRRLDMISNNHVDELKREMNFVEQIGYTFGLITVEKIIGRDIDKARKLIGSLEVSVQKQTVVINDMLKAYFDKRESTETLQSEFVENQEELPKYDTEIQKLAERYAAEKEGMVRVNIERNIIFLKNEKERRNTRSYDLALTIVGEEELLKEYWQRIKTYDKELTNVSKTIAAARAEVYLCQERQKYQTQATNLVGALSAIYGCLERAGSMLDKVEKFREKNAMLITDMSTGKNYGGEKETLDKVYAIIENRNKLAFEQ